MIDQRVIEAHQRIVDESERQPKWLAEHVAWAYTAAGLVSSAFMWNGTSGMTDAAISLLSGVLCIFISRSTFFLSLIGSVGSVRILLWGLLALRVYMLVVKPEPWRAAYLLQELLGLSFLYFAACKPPRPRKRRQIAAQGTA